jgi:hypothetical protein
MQYRRKQAVLAVSCVFAAAASMVAVVGCSAADQVVASPSTAAPKPSVESASHDCPFFAAARWVDVPTKDPNEPRLRIPQPAGWERVEGFDNDEVRMVLRNDALGNGTHAPTITILVEEGPASVTTADQLLHAEVQNLDEQGFTNIAETPATVCGFAAKKVTFIDPPSDTARGKLPARPTTVVMAAPNFDGHLWGAGVLIQATSDDATFTADLNTVLAGFQILSPAAEPGNVGKEKGR